MFLTEGERVERLDVTATDSRAGLWRDTLVPALVTKSCREGLQWSEKFDDRFCSGAVPVRAPTA